MRCPHHPERIADQCCALCGRWTCGQCASLDPNLGAGTCSNCRSSRLARAGGLDEAAAGRTSRLGSLPVALTVLAVLVAAGVLATILLDRPGRGGHEGFDNRHALLLAAYQGLETTGLALEAYRAREGHYPESLDLLVPTLLPAVPVDPFDPENGSLVYLFAREGAGGRLLYSRGPDRLDQRGLPLDPLTRTGDLLYPVE